MKHFVLVSCFLAVFQLSCVPITVISPSKVDSVNGYVISTTGTYLLSDDIIFTYAGGTATVGAISITSSNVTLDLNGKSITATTVTSPASTICGVLVTGAAGNVTIKNGTITSRNVSVAWSNNHIGGLLEDLNLVGQAGINSSFGIVVQNCIIRSVGSNLNVSLGASHYINNCKFLDGPPLIITGANTTVQNCVFERTRSTFAISITGQGCVLDNCVTVSCLTGTVFTVGGTGFFLSGADTVVKNCAAYLCGTGFSVSGAGVVVKGCIAANNAVNGFTNDSSTAVMMGNISIGNSVANYAGTGPVSYIQVNNGAQLPPGSVVDPKIDNISIV